MCCTPNAAGTLSRCLLLIAITFFNLLLSQTCALPMLLLSQYITGLHYTHEQQRDEMRVNKREKRA